MGELDPVAVATPTTEDVRDVYTDFGIYPADDFDRWLAARDAEVAARALRDAAEEWASDPEPVGDTSADYRNWLRDRADRIEGVS